MSKRLRTGTGPASPALALAAMLVLAGCAAAPPQPVLRRAAPPEAAPPAGPALVDTGAAAVAEGAPLRLSRPGTGELINRSAAAPPRPSISGRGDATFNFEGDSLHAVVKVILGDLLEQNYVVAPGVQGTVTMNTPQPVDADQALSLLETALAWNNARMIWADGRYNIVPADQALPGNLAPRADGVQASRGYEVRVVPLRFIGAAEMEKLLAPYARPDAVVGVDAARNLISLGGSRGELENYLRTIEIFDVDWLAGMSVGVFPLQSTAAAAMVSQLEEIYGSGSGTPVAGMVRFMPLEGVNAVLVITPQPKYLHDIEEWIRRIDSGGQASNIYVYEVRHSRAVDLAAQLSAAFGASAATLPRREEAFNLVPGTEPVEVRVLEASGDIAQRPRAGGVSADGAIAAAGGDGVTITAVEENNALIVRSTASQWDSIRRAIDRLDVMPLQVHIEAQVVEVKLSGALSYGVSWFFRNAIEDPNLRAEARTMTGTQPIAGSITDSFSYSVLRRNSLAVLEALDSASDVRILSAPSVVVRNNAEAQLQAGRQIPVASTFISPITGGGTDTSNTVVQFRQTGVTLRVRPRAAANGMVFMEIAQDVSTPSIGGPEIGGNISVDNRSLSTEVAVRSGDTVMLAGLINDERASGRSGVPGLSRIPVLGGLFGTQSQTSDREEVVVLITPTVIRDPDEARGLTDEYSRRFRALEPLQPGGRAGDPGR